ncbi:DEAD/DEAH box helicase [Chloroflexia bacterium SDU3-3]|nr:DEAD/DEAH box helicase [Chloroflexia bacterium SDU3-3]
MKYMPELFDDILLRYGPWQEFERTPVRLLLHAGWKNPRVVGRSGDSGADILATDPKGAIWVFQCKFSSKTPPGKQAINEIRKAGMIYDADKLGIITSQQPTRAFFQELERLKGFGLQIQHLGPEDLKKASYKVPLYVPSRPTLRDYQAEAVERLRSAVLESGHGLIVLATGLGKTVIVAELVADLLSDGFLDRGRILVLAHTVTLVNQLLTSFWRHLPKTIPTHRLADGEKPSFFEGITFATVQSLSNANNLPYFDLVIVDEAHHLGAPGYSKTIEQLNPSKLIGITATPWRAEGTPITSILGKPVFYMGIKEGLAQGYLSNVDYRIYLDSIDWKLVKSESQYGYTIGQLNKKLIIPIRDDEAIHKIREVYDSNNRRRCIVFSPSQIHAQSFASDLRRSGFTAASLTNTDEPTIRFKILSQFAANKIQFICVVDIFNEGVDVPDVDMLVFLRVTHSRRIFVQQLGRGLRLSPTKDNVIVMDFAADIRRIHAAFDLLDNQDDNFVERLPLPHAVVNFIDRSMGNFFYEWIADLGNIQDYEEDELVRLPILDPNQFNFPE